METAELIRALASDATRPSWPQARMWWSALFVGVALAGLVFFLAVGPRADFLAALGTIRFPFKFVVAVSLALSAFGVLQALSRPGEDLAGRGIWLAAPALLLLAAVSGEMLAVPSGEWSERLVGTYSSYCLTFIPLIGIGPLMLFLLTLRHGAPTRPRLAGGVAGLLAGGLAAGFYAAHCPDDSPLFVAVWYSIAIAALAAIGAVLGHRIARW